MTPVVVRRLLLQEFWQFDVTEFTITGPHQRPICQQL
jgi:hypothetical protein